MRRYRFVFMISTMVVVVFIALLSFFKYTNAFNDVKKIDGIEDVAQTFDEFEIPEGVRVVGIGEATHGNREFQLAKKAVLEKVVNEGEGRCICFEMATGDAAMINDAIHDKSSDLVQVIGKQSYPLYDTDEMVQLLKWMRDYNMTVPYEESLMFYGVDIQGAQTAITYMQELCDENDTLFTLEEKEKLLSIKTETKDDYKADRDFFDKLSQRLSKEEGLKERQLSIVAKCVVLHIDAPDYDKDQDEFGKNRDFQMAQLLKDYSELEDARGYAQVVITAHNAHVMKGGSSVLPAADDDTMGDRIDALFEGSYFCIGTGFYEGNVNIHTAGTYEENYERKDHFYVSDDPFAYQARFFENGTYCLDFSKVTDENSSVYKKLHSYVFTGLVGEGYSPLNDLFNSHRTSMILADRYDALICYYEVTPIDPIDY
ncbi:erythromycin esterase family protein [Butyrivibrio fibrisolvens]|uniref:erythromycin esterase family protein n=1 Tax=Butyrivibrio fibrisolvens TaxID=831 RepID=UPI0020BFF17E|nr:erythromycin esterase family protein [Butyrivibrio fibrisolvens]